MSLITPPSFLIPQRVVTISIINNSNGYKALYSYTSPVSGQQYFRAPTCELTIDQPTYCLFVLDFDATQAGWTIQGTFPILNSPTLDSTPGPLNLSILTYDPYQPVPDPDQPLTIKYRKYRFFISYMNPALQVGFPEDPQEGNGPRAVVPPTP